MLSIPSVRSFVQSPVVVQLLIASVRWLLVAEDAQQTQLGKWFAGILPEVALWPTQLARFKLDQVNA